MLFFGAAAPRLVEVVPRLQRKLHRSLVRDSLAARGGKMAGNQDHGLR